MKIDHFTVAPAICVLRPILAWPWKEQKVLLYVPYGNDIEVRNLAVRSLDSRWHQPSRAGTYKQVISTMTWTWLRCIWLNARGSNVLGMLTVAACKLLVTVLSVCHG